MIQRTILLFTEREEELLNLLIDVGIPKNSAKIIVFLGKTPVATLREIELGIDERACKVSGGVKYLIDRGWMKSWKIKFEKKPYWSKKCRLIVPLEQIVSSVEMQKETEAREEMTIVKKIRRLI
jgi:predicted transcriptional regulator